MVIVVQTAHFTRSVAKVEENEGNNNGHRINQRFFFPQNGQNQCIFEDIGYRRKKKLKKLETKEVVPKMEGSYIALQSNDNE